MSSAASSTGSSKTETKIASDGPPPSMGTASPCRSGRAPTTSSPVTSAALRAAAGSDNGRSRGLRPEAPVSPRVPLGGSPPAHLTCLRESWKEFAPSLQARLRIVSIADMRANLDAAEAAQASAPSEADLCAMALAQEEYQTVIRPLQAVATDLEGRHRANAAAMLSAERQHLAYMRHFRGDPRPSGKSHATERPLAPSALASSHAPAGLEWRQVAAVGPCRRDRTPSPPARTARAPSPLPQVAPNPMDPPDARVHFAKTGPWSLVAPRRQKPSPGPYENLRISRLRHVNSQFPANIRREIKEVATCVQAAFEEYGSNHCCVARAIKLATASDIRLSAPLRTDVFRLRDLLDSAYDSPSGAAWIQGAPCQTASSGSETSSSARSRRREDPSSGRGNSKKASLTSDSEDQPESRGRYFRDHRKG